MSIDVISQGIRMISKENRKWYMVTCATVGAHEQGVNLSKNQGIHIVGGDTWHSAEEEAQEQR
jgi:hypothetical protein